MEKLTMDSLSKSIKNARAEGVTDYYLGKTINQNPYKDLKPSMLNMTLGECWKEGFKSGKLLVKASNKLEKGRQ